ncbi:hypothetical protein [Nocardia sp. JMUB6875]|uniref:hypothetical protein n=1 Tax=Nocardia sp. JMUB6875 TaxID=3158170 RepID=UPI0034E8A518
MPDKSTHVECTSVDGTIGIQIFEATHSPAVSASVLASPFAMTALTVAAQVRAALWSGRKPLICLGLTKVADVAPRKGGEIPRMVAEYLRRHPAIDPADASPMAMNDFCAGCFYLQFIRVTDGRVLDLCGSALSLTMAVDHSGESDDSGGGGVDAYLAAASEGLACLAGKGADQALRDIVISCAAIRIKNRLSRELAEITDLDGLVRSRGGAVTPAEFFLARWWDGMETPYFRIALCADGYQDVTDDLGTLTGWTCARIRRTLYNFLRHNECVDLISDYLSQETFNEALLALVKGGPSSLHGYASAVAAVTDDVLACPCGVTGHQEAAEIAMGSCLWNLLEPRYLARQQLAAYAANTAVADAYSWPLPGNRLKAAGPTLQLEAMLHSPTWQPLWEHHEHTRTGRTWAAELARRAVRRSVLHPLTREESIACEALAEEILLCCERLDDRADLHALATRWSHLFETITALTLTRLDGPSIHHSIAEFHALIGRIWKHAVIGPDPENPATETDECLCFDLTQAFRHSYLLPHSDGIRIRRAFLGVASSAVELSGFNPFARLTNGTAALCETPEPTECV